MSSAEHTERGRGRVLAIVLTLVLVAGAAFAIGRFTAFGASAVPATPGNTSAEAGFARDMQTHHAQAVEMAMTIYDKTENAEIRAIAFDISTSQSVQQGWMQEWLIDWQLPAFGKPMAWMSGEHDNHGGSAEDPMTAMGMASTEELGALDAATGTEADCLFLQLMIRHHEGAVSMTDAVLELGSYQRVLDVARTMSAAQTAEIDAMRALQVSIGCNAG